MEDADRWPHLVRLVAMGAVCAVALAVFGLPPVDIHGPLHYVRIMDPLCGMTRAIRLLARGQLSLAMTYNPAVVLLPLFAVGVVARWVSGRVSGRWLHLSMRWSVPVVGLAVAAVALLWIRQQAHVDLLTAR